MATVFFIGRGALTDMLHFKFGPCPKPSQISSLATWKRTWNTRYTHTYTRPYVVILILIHFNPQLLFSRYLSNLFLERSLASLRHWNQRERTHPGRPQHRTPYKQPWSTGQKSKWPGRACRKSFTTDLYSDIRYKKLWSPTVITLLVRRGSLR